MTYTTAKPKEIGDSLFSRYFSAGALPWDCAKMMRDCLALATDCAKSCAICMPSKVSPKMVQKLCKSAAKVVRALRALLLHYVCIFGAITHNLCTIPGEGPGTKRS